MDDSAPRIHQFINKWRNAELSERAASHEHFIDLCRLLGQPTPAEHDSTGAEYTFEKGVRVLGGPASRSEREAQASGRTEDSRRAGDRDTHGFADVWWRHKFGWEYKRKGRHDSLAEAYRQLCQYREALENPPLLIVCDIARIEIHTNFTNHPPSVITVKLEEIGHPDSLSTLRRIFTDPESFKPSLTTWKLTESVAADFAKIADWLRQQKHDPHTAAHFLMKCMFCLFAEDVNLLPAKLFSRLLENTKAEPEKAADRLTALFRAMQKGGFFGADSIAWFNGGLFDDAPALPLNTWAIHNMLIAAVHDWGAVEPSIFGTLFERSLDPSKRAQIGAHYTSRDDIMLIVEPVVMAPLRREWADVQAKVEQHLQKRRAAATKAAKEKQTSAIIKLLNQFQERLTDIRILDPACGSGNFLYVAIQQLLALEKDVIVFAGRHDIVGAQLFPQVRPTQLHGIEINPYAAELAQVVIWIGYLQWMKENGFDIDRNPILAPLQTIENRDAILDLTIPSKPQRATWPDADFIIGNPPFLGSKLFRANGLDDDYVRAMYAAYDLPKTSDLCCYWFEQGRSAIQNTKRKRVATRKTSDGGTEPRISLLATQGIRGGDNRTVLERIKQTGDIFMAWSDRDWILDGAAVHVSMLGFDGGNETTKLLEGQRVSTINPDLTSTSADLTTALILSENCDIAYMGTTKGGAFDIDVSQARDFLAQANPNGRPNSEVVKPWINGSDINGRNRGMWIIDFGFDMQHDKAAQYEGPFRYVEQNVRPQRSKNRREAYVERWWIHVEPRPALRAATGRLPRYLETCRVAKHRLFAWFTNPTLPDSATFAFARADDYFFGILHSSIHELWSLRMGTQLEDRPRYTPTTCFETFPIPWPPGQEPADSSLYQRIAEAARDLNDQRERWLNPPDWIADLARLIDARDKFEDVPAEARPLIRHSAIMAAAAKDPRLKKRTLTNLYNERPTWLKLAHEKLDRAVLAAYTATDPEGGWPEDWAEVWKETGAGQPLPEGHGLTDQRKQTDQRVLTNLLRVNLARAKQGS